MARPVPYTFGRYEFSRFEKGLSRLEQFNLLQSLTGIMVAHRKADPSSDDLDTFIMRPASKTTLGHPVLTWYVAQSISARAVAQYNRSEDDIDERLIETDEIKYGRFVALPLLGVLAIDSRTSDPHLGMTAARSRLLSVINTQKNCSVRIELAGSHQDLAKALDSWALRSFSFTVQPFNPSTSAPGDKLHRLMEADRMAKLRSVATPVRDDTMKNSGEGLIAEVSGLSEDGYGHAAAMGTTPQGYDASIGSPKFEGEREKNLKQAAGPRQLRVYVNAGATVEQEEEDVVKALLEFFGALHEDKPPN